MRLSVIGLGKLGASMAACFAGKGFSVIGVDVDPHAVEAVNAGRAPVGETGLGEAIAANRERLRATLDHAEAVRESDVSFVIVPTPSDSRGAFSLQYAKFAFEAMGKGLAEKKGYHVVVLTSTVLPGSMRYGLLPVLEKASGKKCGPDFGLCYNPEFIALGSIMHDFLNPDFYLLGECDKRAGDMVAAVHAQASENKAPIARMSLENAELTKVSLNSAVTMKISLANMLCELAEQIPGGDIDVVTRAIGSDERIGRKYFTGGLGFGGPCFPRDNVALGFTGRHLGVPCDLLAVNDAYNRGQAARLTERLVRRIPAGTTVAVLGLAYKPATHVVEESQSLELCKRLSDAGYRVIGYDPLAGGEAKTVLAYHTLVAPSLEECLRNAGAVVVTTRDPAFTGLTAETLLGGREHVIVVDCWRCLAPEVAAHPGIEYIALGRCQDDDAAAATLRNLWSPEGNA